MTGLNFLLAASVASVIVGSLRLRAWWLEYGHLFRS